MRLPGKLSAGCAWIFAAGTTHAALLLAGNTAGFFQPVSDPAISITNTTDGLEAAFRTGIPAPGSFKSGVGFNGQDFSQVGDGDTFSLGFLTYYNGLTRIGTSSGSALLDFYLNFADPAIGSVHLTTIKFGIDATVNNHAVLTPDAFKASFLQPAPVWLGDQWVQFTINDLPDSTLVAENAAMNLASVTVTVIPELPGGAALMGMLALTVAVLFRARLHAVRIRREAA
jgi:hypothetical protein